MCVNEVGQRPNSEGSKDQVAEGPINAAKFEVVNVEEDQPNTVDIHVQYLT